MRVKFPPAPPFAVGVKVTLRFTLWPAGKDAGTFTPDQLKLDWLTVIAEIFTVVCPVLVTVMS